MPATYAELHCRSNFSFLDGASPVEDLVGRAVELGLSGLAITDFGGLYGVVRFATEAEAMGIRPIIGIEIELVDAAAPDPNGIVIPARRERRRSKAAARIDGFLGLANGIEVASEGTPARPRPTRTRLPGHRSVVKEDLRGIGERQRGPRLVLLARNAAGYRSLCRLTSHANLAGTKRVPRFSQALLAEHTEGLLALSGGRESEIARRLLVGDRDGARIVAERYAAMFGRGGGSGGGASGGRRRGAPVASGSGDDVARAGFFLELTHHLRPDDDWLVAETARLAAELGLPVVVANDVHYARREDRELQDVLTAINHGRTLETLGDLRRSDGESYLKSGFELAALPPGDPETAAIGADPVTAAVDALTARAWAEGIATAGEIAATCSVDLGFEQYRFPGFPVPKGETPFSYLSELCWNGARRRYHPLTPAVVDRLAHELGVIERSGLAEFFLICWDLMRFAKEQGIPAQGRGSATSSIISYTLGISRVEPIAHNLLFERFINEGRTTYPDVDIDFSSERREEIIQYVYRRYGPEHTGMVCNLVTYRARSAVREVGYALGFPRPLVDRVAKALETYDSVMVRRDLEADGGFAEFFRRPGEGVPAESEAADAAESRGLVDGMGQLNHERGGRVPVGEQLVDGMGPLNKRLPLVGKVPPWRQAPKPADPTAPRPFAWLAAVRSEPSPIDSEPEPELEPELAPEPELASPSPASPRPASPSLGHENSRTPPRVALDEGITPGSPSTTSRVPEFIPAQARLGTNRVGDSLANPPPDGPILANATGGGVRRISAGESGLSAESAGSDEPAGAPRAPFGAGLFHMLAGGALGEVVDDLPAETRQLRPENVPSQARPGMNSETAVGMTPAGSPDSGSNAPPMFIGYKSSVVVTEPGPSSASEPGPSASGMWEGAPESPPAIRPGGRTDDEGGPGDTPASVAWLRAGRGTGYGAAPRLLASAPGTVDGRQIDPESGALAAPSRRTEGRGRGAPSDGGGAGGGVGGRGGERGGGHGGMPGGDGGSGGEHGSETDRLGRPHYWPQPDNIRGGIGVDRIGRADPHRDGPHSSVARVEPESAPQARGGSTVGLSDWERWLEFCARIDGFPRHLSIHSGGMLVTAAPLIDIAPLERATMKDRVVVQFDKRDIETLKLIKLDLLGLGMLAAIDETLQLIEHDCGTCVVLDAIPEQVPEVFEMIQAADSVGVFQIESRAQMQTLPKSRPKTLDDLVVEVAIIRPGPIQGNAVHPFLRRKQGLEPVTYLHPSLEPVLRDSMGVILYQEQVMRIAIEVAGFSPAESDGFRRAMGTWRSNREMEKLHERFHDGCMRQPDMTEEIAEELFRQVAAFASFGFAKSHAAAFARTAYESSFLKLFYPAQFLVGLINAQPMGFYPVEVLVNDTKRHGVSVLPVDINASSYKTTTEWVGRPGWALAGVAGDDGTHDTDPGEPLPEDAGIEDYARPVRSSSCFMPGFAAREQWSAGDAIGWGVRLGLHLVKGIGKQHEALLDRERDRGPYASLADVVERTGLPEETIEQLIRTGGLDSLGRPRRELLWQLREVAGSARGRVDGRSVRAAGRAKGKRSTAEGRPMDLRLPATEAPDLPAITEPERLGDAYGVIGLDARRQVISLFRPALDRLGAVPNGALADRRPGPVRLAGLVVTRQHPMTAKGTVFLALEDETGMVNVTLWPDTWARLRGVVRRHALLLVDGDLQRESSVVNVVAREVRSLTEVAEAAGGPETPTGVRQLGHAGMRRLG